MIVATPNDIESAIEILEIAARWYHHANPYTHEDWDLRTAADHLEKLQELIEEMMQETKFNQ